MHKLLQRRKTYFIQLSSQTISKSNPSPYSGCATGKYEAAVIKFKIEHEQEDNSLRCLSSAYMLHLRQSLFGEGKVSKINQDYIKTGILQYKTNTVGFKWYMIF